jgi:cytoskeletal protein CcmA (bactofilin family)
MTMTDTKKTLIEEGTELKGTINSTCPIVVMGRVEGEMSGPSVEVTESGILSGKAKVAELRSRGELAGDFEADLVELSGKVRDRTSIRAQSLEVSLHKNDGRVEVVFGDCELSVGDAPDKAAAIRAATGAPQARAGAEPAVAAHGGGEVAAVDESAVSGKNGRRKKGTDESHETA